MKNIPQFLKDLMKFIVFCGLLLAMLIPVFTSAQVNTNFWKLSSGLLSPILSSFTVQVSNQSSDPAGANGAIYYNTGSNVFRCYQNGTWTNCIGTGGGGGTSGGTWSTTTSQVTGHFINYPNNSTDIVVVGSSATTTSNYYIDPNINFAFFKNASTTALTATNLFFTNATGTTLNLTNLLLSAALPISSGGTNSGSFTTAGNGIYYNGTQLLTAPLTSAVTYPYASSTGISATGEIFANNAFLNTNIAINQTPDNTLIPDGNTQTPGMILPNHSFNTGNFAAIQTMNATTSGESGNELDMYAGSGATTGNGGAINIATGNGGSQGNGGNLVLITGSGGSVSGNGGSINLEPSAALVSSGSNGAVFITDPTSFKTATFITAPLTANRVFSFPDITGMFSVATGTLEAPSFVSTSSQANYFKYSSSTGITTANLWGAGLSNCGPTFALQWANGIFSCLAVSGGGGTSPWATTTSQVPSILTIAPLNKTDIVTVGTNSTSTASFYIDPNTSTMFFGTTTSGNSTITVGSTGNEWSLGENTSGNVFEISSSTTLGTNDGFKIDKNLLVTMGNASTTMLSASSGIFNANWEVSTSTTICPDNQTVGCQYIGGAGLQQAITDGWNSIKLKNGSYTITSPIYVPRSGFTMIGEGNSTIIRYDGHVVKVGIMTSNPGVEFGNMLLRDFQVKEDSTGGLSTCIDNSHIVTSKIEHIQCNDQAFGFMASTGQSYYNTYDTDEVTHLISHNGNNPLLAVGFYLGDPTGGDSGPIDNTIINSIVDNFVNGSSTAYYFASHSIKCISCDSEGGYIGMHLAGRASDFNGLVYLEANTINLTIDASSAQVGGYNITGNISDATPLSNNIVDNGAAGLCVNARVQYAAVNYCTNIKQGFGTSNPLSVLEISNRFNRGNTPGLSNDSPGLFGGLGTAINLDYWSGGASVSGRSIVNDSTSDNFPILDFVVATSSTLTSSSTELGLRLVAASSIGKGDMFIQPETATSGYAVFEGRASSTLGTSNAGTMISSEAAPVILAPNRTERLRVDYPSGNVGIGTTSPGTLLSIGNVSAINLSIGTSTWNTAGGININTGCFAIKGVCISGGGGGTVSSVSNADGTLSIAPTTGAVVAGLNLGKANSWLALQTFGNASTTNISASYASSTLGVFGTVKLPAAAGSGTNCLQTDNNGVVTLSGGACGTGTVNNVSNSDGSLTISPTTGNVVGTLNIAHQNIWIGKQAFVFATSSNATSTLLTATTAWLGSIEDTSNNVLSFPGEAGTFALASGGQTGMLAGWSDANTITATSTPTASSYIATGTVSSIFPYASTTAITSSGTAVLALNGGFVTVGTSTNIDPVTGAARAAFLVQQQTDNATQGMAVLNQAGANSMRLWEDSNGASRIDSGSNGQGNLILNSLSGGPVGISTTTPTARLSIGTVGNTLTSLFLMSTSSLNSTTTALFVDYLGNFYFKGGSGIAMGTDVQPPGSGLITKGNIGIATTSPNSALSVQGNEFIAGNITSTSTATSSFAGGVNLTGTDCFAYQGTCLQTLVSSASAYKQAVKYASTSTLPANTYNNGVSGVGATITGTALAPLFIDGNTAALGDRILVKNEATGANNGIYTITTVGVGGVTAFVLTRATDYNSSADVFPGVASFVNSGTTNANTCWILTNTTAVTIGSTALTYDDACGAGSYTGTSPIVINGTNITFVAPATSALSIPYASSTSITSTNGAAFATVSGGVGIGTTTPESVLDVKGTGTNQGLFGLYGSAISLFNGASGRRITADFNGLDFVIASSTESGVRFAKSNVLGTNDVLVQPEVQSNGYAIFEGFSTSSAVAGTAISSQNSSVILAPNRSSLLYATTNGRIGISTTTPAATLGVQGNQFIAGNITSTSTLSSVFPYASTTALDAVTYLNVANGGTYNYNGIQVLKTDSQGDDILLGGIGNNPVTIGFNLHNISIGYQAMRVMNNGTNNLAMGFNALTGNTSGSDNVSLGTLALQNNVTGNQNLALGTFALNRSTNNGNIGFGYAAGDSLTGGSANIAIGQNVDFASTTGSGQLDIGNVLFGIGLYAGNSTTSVASLGSIGVGTTTPWGTFSVMNSLSNNPLISVSMQSVNTILSVFGTTSIQALGSTGTTVPAIDIGARIGIGTVSYHNYGGLLDQLTVRGRINTEGWNQAFCDTVSAQGGSAQSNLCGSFAAGAAIATNPVFTDTANNAQGYGYAAANISATGAANAGAAFYFSNNSGTTGYLAPATSTPVMEVNGRIEFPQNSTSSVYYIGFDSNTKNGTMTVTAPANGCFFTASSSASTGDWYAVAVSGSTGTWIDTKIASSTNITSKGGFYKFRIEASNNLCNFYIQNAEANPLTNVASITTNVPNSTGLNASVWLTTVSAGATQVSLDFNHFRVWWRDFLPSS